MSLNVKHLNSDASFLLTFQPLPTTFPPVRQFTKNTFKVVLDPWLSGPSKVLHPRFSISRHKVESCVKSLNDLEDIDLIVISQDKSDHCHKETLTQLPRDGGNTLILAEPSAAKLIRSWKYFEPKKVITVPKFEHGKPSTIHRIPIPSTTLHGIPGEVTITFLAQKMDLTRVHSAIAMTYRPPHNTDDLDLTPPATPKSSGVSSIHLDRALSVIHAPHGVSYKTLQDYATSHLVQQAALPLTALLHCFDRIQNAWYLGGNICSGMPGGVEIAQKLCARVWISAHDGEKDIKGLANRKLVVSKYEREEIEQVVSPRSERFTGKIGTEVVALGVGEEMFLTHPMDLCIGSDDASEQHMANMHTHIPTKSSSVDSEEHVAQGPLITVPEEDNESVQQANMAACFRTPEMDALNAEAGELLSMGSLINDMSQNPSFDSKVSYNSESSQPLFMTSLPNTSKTTPSPTPRNSL